MIIALINEDDQSVIARVWIAAPVAMIRETEWQDAIESFVDASRARMRAESIRDWGRGLYDGAVRYEKEGGHDGTEGATADAAPGGVDAAAQLVGV